MTNWDKDLHDQRVSDLFSAGSVEQPSDELDRTVRDSARQQEPQRAGQRALWRSVATAAVIVLAIGLIRVQQEQGLVEEPLLAPQESDFVGKPAPVPAAPVEMEERKARAMVEPQRMELSRQKSMESRAGQQVEKAAVAEMADSMAPAVAKREISCSGIAPPEADRAVWLALYRELIAQGRLDQAECLSGLFRERFGELPDAAR
jgi:imidazolonepropionase-like amidohydrolase